MGRRGGRKGGQGRAQDRVRERVRGGARRGGGNTGRRRGGFGLGDVDADAIGDYAGRLTDRSGGGGSGLAGAAAGLAGGGLAGRFLGGSGGSDEDLRSEVADQFAAFEERLRLLEDQVRELREMSGDEPPGGDPAEPGIDPGAEPGGAT